jgi:hypothetical protein
MQTQLNVLHTETEEPVNSAELIELDGLIEQIWHDLNGQVPLSRVRQVALEVAAEFHTATVTMYIPLFIRRYTRERLEESQKDEVTL